MLNKILTPSQLSSHNSVIQVNSSIKISSESLIAIAEKASIISERLSGEFIPKKLETEQHLIDTKLEKWCQVAAKGNQERFAKRLSWDNLDIDVVRATLGSVSLADKEALPAWTDTLKKAMEVAACYSERVFSEESQQYFDSEKPLPFEEVLLPFVEVAMEELIGRASSSYEILSDKACIQLGQSLLKQLTDLFAQCLDLEFSIFRAYRGSHLVRLIGQLQGNSSRKQYVEFVKGLLSDGLLAFFQEYSVLAQLAAIATDFWIEANSEFLLRLASDWNEIQQIFHENQQLGEVVDLKLSLSDPHNRGRTVIIIKFASNLKLVYKPKSLGLEQAYFEFISWINQQGITLPLKTLRIINSYTHGWMEFVEALPCEDQQAVKRYYQRAGMILAIVYTLKGTDCHCENLIACGEQPVLVDLETLFHHTMWMKEENPEAILLASQKLADSVIVTVLLPGVHIVDYKEFGELANALDYCGFGGLNKQSVSAPVFKWVDVNTDSMAMGKEEKELLSENNNQPYGENLDTSLSKHIEELIAGFQQMYQFFVQYKETLLAPDSPITVFSGEKVRLVLRNTQLYASILQNSLHPRCLRDGVDRSIELDILALGFTSLKDKHPSWAILAPEKQALEQLDIPYISAYSDSDAIAINSNTTIEKFVGSSSYDDVIARLQQLDDTNLAEQISIIQGSFYSSLTSEQLDLSTLSNTTPNLKETAPLSEEAILDRAIEIAQELQQQAISGKNNSVAWLGMIYDFQAQRFQLRPMGHSLYNGSSGGALFLAALASVTNKAEFGDLALGSLQSLRQGLQEQDPELKQPFLKHIGMGGATGLASIVYTFVRIAGFLSEPKLIDDARKISFWLKVDASAVEEAGIIKGAAGTILSLLALYKVTQESETLEQAIAWGNYLLDQRVTTDTNSKIWKNVEEESLTGFSQGIAGIAYALLQLYATTKNSDFLSAAKEAIAYEQSYSMATDNLSPLASWCYGLPGIVLARLGSLSILNTEEIHQEIEIALPKIQQPSLKALDNLCCGNFADIEVLLVAAEQLSRPEFLETARQQTALVLHIGEGNSGDISADVSGAVILDDADSVGLSSRITNQALSPAVGNSGDINIKAESLTVKQGSFLNASISGRGNSGNILVDVKGGVIFEGEGSEFFSGIGNQVLSLGVGNSGDINIKAESLILGQGNDLNASTLGRGNGGDIFVDVSGAVIINADGGIFSVVRSSAIGNGGNINIKAESLKIRQSGALNTFTLGRGNAGNISVDVKGAVIVDGNNTDFNTGIATIVTESAIGNGGDINLKAGSLTLTQGGLLSASTEGRGSAGNIFVDVKGAVSLDGIDSRGFSSGIDTQVFPLAVGDGGDISIKAESLAITQGGFLSTTTSGEENSGNISVDVSGAVTLDGMGSSDFSRITTQVAESGIGNSGDINLKAESLTITQEAFVSTATFAQGNGGDIGISLTMPNSRLTLSDEAAIAANTLGQGKGGNIQIEAFKSVNLTNDSQISVNSEGEGNAGELGIKTGSLNLQGRSRLLADTFSSEGGNIQLQVRDILLLRNNSSISTTAGQQGTGGNGGNIDINTKFLVAVPEENSDITANAFEGKGGLIKITTQGIFGIEKRENLTPLSDITAFSQQNPLLDGEIVIDIQNADIRKELVALPTNLVDVSGLISQGCAAGRVPTNQPESQFIVTGRGGLPPQPGDALRIPAIAIDESTVASEKEDQSLDIASTPLLEANSWRFDKQGQVVLTASNASSFGIKQGNCHGS